MISEATRRAWSAFPFWTKAGFVVLAVVLVGWALTSTVGWARESWRAHKYEEGQRKERELRVKAEQDSQADRARADALEARVPVLEAQLAAKEDLIAEANARIRAEDAKIEEATRVHEAQIATSDLPVSPAERRRRICEAYAKLGRPCTPAPGSH